MMDPSTPAALLQSGLANVIGAEAAQVVGVAFAWLTLSCFACTLIAQHWPPPPAGSKLAVLHRLVSLGAGAFSYLKSAYQPSRTAVMVPTEQRADVRTAVAEKLSIPREMTKP